MTKGAQAYNGVQRASSVIGVGRTGLVHAKKKKRKKERKKIKKETRPPPYTIHQNKLKMNKRLKYVMIP